MDSRKFVLKETAIIALGQLICVAVMIGVFALLGKFDRSVWLGGIFGGILATLNFMFMAIGVSMAADKAHQQEVSRGQLTVRISYFARMIVLFVLLFALIKSGLCNVITAVLPLVFTRLILTIAEFFRKSGEEIK
jgi:TRAP-type C4-dicarboxylate transport system permease large subunit